MRRTRWPEGVALIVELAESTDSEDLHRRIDECRYWMSSI